MKPLSILGVLALLATAALGYPSFPNFHSSFFTSGFPDLGPGFRTLDFPSNPLSSSSSSVTNQVVQPDIFAQTQSDIQSNLAAMNTGLSSASWKGLSSSFDSPKAVKHFSSSSTTSSTTKKGANGKTITVTSITSSAA